MQKRGFSKSLLCLCQATCRVLCASLVSSIWKGLLAFGESLKKRTTKLIKYLGNLGYEERLKKPGLLSFKYRRLRGGLIKVFKLIKCRHAGYLRDMFEISDVNRGRGHQHKLAIKHSRTRLRQSFFFFARTVVGHWSRLSKDIVSVNTPESFKTQLDKHFIGKRLAYKYSWDKTISVSAPTVPCIGSGEQNAKQLHQSWCPRCRCRGTVEHCSISICFFSGLHRLLLWRWGCNLLWALVVLIGQKFIIVIFAILCHFCHYAIACH